MRSRLAGMTERSTRWSAHVPLGQRALEVRRGTAWPRRRLRPRRATPMSTTPLASCTSIGPTSSGENTPRPPPSIMAGPPMPMFESSVAMITSQAPRRAALPAKQRPELMPIVGTTPLSRAIDENVGVTSGRDSQPPELSRPLASPVRLPPVPARPPPPSVKNTTGRRHGPGELQHAVGLRVVDRALGAGEHGVVVGQHDGARRRRAELVAVDAADAADHAVGGELADHLLHRQAGARRQHEAAVLDERAVVAQVVDVLAGRALVGLAAPGHGVGPGVVERDGVALDDLGEVGPDLVEVDLVVDGRGQVADVGRLDEHQRVALEHGVADGDADEAHEAGVGGRHDVLHLHGLHDEELLAGAAPGRPRPRRSARSVPCSGERTAVVPAGPSSGVGGRAVGGAAGGRAGDRPARP